GFALGGFLGWVLNLNWLIKNEGVRSFATKFGVGELWLRAPKRFEYVIILAFAALAGYGVQAWLERKPIRDRRGTLARFLWLIPGPVVFVIWPLAAGSPATQYVGFLAGFMVAVPALLLNSRGRSRFAPALAALVAAELLISGLVAPSAPGPEPTSSALPGTPQPFSRSFLRLRRPVIDPQKYVTPGPIGRILISARGDFGRYLTFDRRAYSHESGFLGFQDSRYWPAYENGRSILFGINEIQGYSPVQLDRYWRLVRRVATHKILYNSATFQSAPPSVLSLFGVKWLIVPTSKASPVPASFVATEGRYTLYEIEHPEPRASFVADWTQVPPGSGLDVVLGRGFDPGRRAIVEVQPTLAGRSIQLSASGTGTAVYDEISPEHILVHVTSNSPGLVVIRNTFDVNWHATVDGKPTPVILTDYLMQGVAAPEGTHTVELTYRDRTVGLGLLISGGGWALLLATIAWFVLGDRRRGKSRRTVARSSDRSPEPLPAP
ncbi:MAG TPA: YfhO family protein, partial [Actinomycetota bacterium]|nr:YfhO family protein [Actinomycetota bacterium]